MKTQTCPRCKIEKPLDSGHFHSSSDSKSGFRYACKVCINASDAARRLKARTPGMKEACRVTDAKRLADVTEEMAERGKTIERIRKQFELFYHDLPSGFKENVYYALLDYQKRSTPSDGFAETWVRGIWKQVP